MSFLLLGINPDDGQKDRETGKPRRMSVIASQSPYTPTRQSSRRKQTVLIKKCNWRKNWRRKWMMLSAQSSVSKNEMQFITVYNAPMARTDPIWADKNNMPNRAHTYILTSVNRSTSRFSIWVGLDHGKQLTSSNQNIDLLTISRITVAKIATEVQTDELTSL